MKFTQVPGKNTATDFSTNHVAQQFSCLSLDNGTEKWRKAVLENLWKSHIDRHSLASIWSVGSRRLSPKQPFAIWQQIDICELNIHK
jgi:hypothetical protein